MKRIVVLLLLFTTILLFTGCNINNSNNSNKGGGVTIKYAPTIQWNNTNYTVTSNIVLQDDIGEQIGLIKKNVNKFPKENDEANDYIKVGTALYTIKNENSSEAIAIKYNNEYLKALIMKDIKINYENIDKLLSNLKFEYSTSIDKKYITVVTCQPQKNILIEQYLIDKDGTLGLSMPKNSEFIISLPANRTIAYTWNINNNINNGIIQFNKQSWANIPMPISENNRIGENYDRQNFFFNTVKVGSEKIVIRYEHQTEKNNNFFQINFNINIY